MNELVDAMTAVDPEKRPAIEEVVAEFSRIRKSLSAFQLCFAIADNRNWLSKRTSVIVEVKSYIN